MTEDQLKQVAIDTFAMRNSIAWRGIQHRLLIAGCSGKELRVLSKRAWELRKGISRDRPEARRIRAEKRAFAERQAQAFMCSALMWPVRRDYTVPLEIAENGGDRTGPSDHASKPPGEAA